MADMWQVNFKNIPRRTQEQIRWLQSVRGWTNRTTLFVEAIERIYRAEKQAEQQGLENCSTSHENLQEF